KRKRDIKHKQIDKEKEMWPGRKKGNEIRKGKKEWQKEDRKENKFRKVEKEIMKEGKRQKDERVKAERLKARKQT
ncbi:MAG: hypothetical protein ACRCU6_10460, partial [Fusobacteriaceae bacterium]